MRSTIRKVRPEAWQHAAGRITGAQKGLSGASLVDIARTCSDLSRSLAELGAGNERFWLRAAKGTSKKLRAQANKLNAAVRALRNEAVRRELEMRSHVIRGHRTET